MDHYYTQAIAASKRGDHKKALEYYDRAIARAQSAKLYDGRAACHEALQDLPAALKDAKACIRLAPYDPVGYTRAANVLVTMDRKKPAVEVLALGLRKVKHAGQSFEVLRELHNSLMDEVSPRTCVDPMKALPAEVALMVLDYLTFKQLTNVRSVSKGWNKFICGQERLWYSLDLGDARKKVPHSFIVLAIKSSRRKMNQALLNRLWDFDKAARLLITNCPIRTLTLQAVPKLSEDFIRTLQPAAQLRHLHISQDEKLTPFLLHKLLDSLHSRLESFSCSEVASTEANNVYSMLEFPRLTQLHRSAAMASGVRLLDNGEPNMPALESLIVELGGFGPSYMPIGRLDALKHLKRLVISSASNDVLNSLCSVMPQGLITLKLLCVGIHRLPPEFWQLFSMPLLEELDLCVGAPISFQDLRQSLFSDATDHGKAASLQKLTLQRYAVETTSSEEFTVLCQHQRFCSVQHLGLPFAMGGVGDETMEIISRSCKHITSLDLRDSHVTGVGVKHALSLPSLRELNIVGCPKVGQDAIHWAKGKGLRVLHRAPDALLYERRIRA